MTKIKDPVYGYIELSNDIISIVDTPYFQRLRDIIQTSYSPLFPTSVHNRFSHSLGVYHLGKKAINSLFNNFKHDNPGFKITQKKVNEIKDTFITACLLHDIGHSPYSHTGEYFYLDEKYNSGTSKKPRFTDDSKLVKDLENLLNDNTYRSDMKMQRFCDPKPHELMSAYLGLKVFFANKNKDLQSLFVRCIIGLQYYDCKSLEKQLLNCCIELLNSSTIDVDKLDYLIRDSYMTGFYSINIDYERLITGVSLHKLNPNLSHNIIERDKTDGSKETYRHVFLAFKKQSLSVLENVILANDLERKWIQSHPVVLYSSFLLQILIHNINDKISSEQPDLYLFSYDALSEKGVQLTNYTVRYLSDSDITFLIKNHYYDNWAKEYFNRESWRHPLWKSQAEFHILNESLSDKAHEKLLQIVEDIERDLLYGQYGVNEINKDLLTAYRTAINSGEEIKTHTKASSSKKSVLAVQSKIDPKYKFVDFLYNYCEKNNCSFNFVIVTNKQFSSGFNKKDFKNIQIQFDAYKQNYILSKALPTLESELHQEKYFYIYNKIEPEKSQIDVGDFCKKMSAFIASL